MVVLFFDIFEEGFDKGVGVKVVVVVRAFSKADHADREAEFVGNGDDYPAPPLAVPSSLARIRPVMSRSVWN